MTRFRALTEFPRELAAALVPLERHGLIVTDVGDHHVAGYVEESRLLDRVEDVIGDAAMGIGVESLKTWRVA